MLPPKITYDKEMPFKRPEVGLVHLTSSSTLTNALVIASQRTGTKWDTICRTQYYTKFLNCEAKLAMAQFTIKLGTSKK